MPTSNPESSDCLADEIEALIDLAVHEKTAELQARLEEVDGSFDGRIQRTLSDALIRDDAPVPWSPREFRFGDKTTAAGGTWLCVARRGAREDDTPVPESPVWLSLTTGVSNISAIRTSPSVIQINLELSDGKTETIDIHVPLLQLEGTYTEQRTYAPGQMVMKDGSTWAALRRVQPGEQPGRSDGWSLLAQRGKTGPAVSPSKVRDAIRKLESQQIIQPAGVRIRSSVLFIWETTLNAFPNHSSNDDQRVAAIIFATCKMFDLVASELSRAGGPVGPWANPGQASYFACKSAFPALLWGSISDATWDSNVKVKDLCDLFNLSRSDLKAAADPIFGQLAQRKLSLEAAAKYYSATLPLLAERDLFNETRAWLSDTLAEAYVRALEVSVTEQDRPLKVRKTLEEIDRAFEMRAIHRNTPSFLQRPPGLDPLDDDAEFDADVRTALAPSVASLAICLDNTENNRLWKKDSVHYLGKSRQRDKIIKYCLSRDTDYSEFDFLLTRAFEPSANQLEIRDNRQ